MNAEEEDTMKHLSTEERRALAVELDAMRRRVLAELVAGTPRAADLEGLDPAHEVHTQADQAEDEREDDVRLAELEIDRQRLMEIEQAQLRMADGRYGVCASCGEEIPRGRLLAQPAAIRCAACQAAREVRLRVGGD